VAEGKVGGKRRGRWQKVRSVAKGKVGDRRQGRCQKAIWVAEGKRKRMMLKREWSDCTEKDLNSIGGIFEDV